VECGAPHIRIIEKTKTFESGSGKSGNPINGKQDLSGLETNSTPDIRKGPCVQSKTLGFQTTCTCNSGTKPGVVLDPFNGSGTTGAVALQYNRDYIGIDLNPEYLELTRKRLSCVQPELF
jgi:hypothetical protein